MYLVLYFDPIAARIEVEEFDNLGLAEGRVLWLAEHNCTTRILDINARITQKTRLP